MAKSQVILQSDYSNLGPGMEVENRGRFMDDSLC